MPEFIKMNNFYQISTIFPIVIGCIGRNINNIDYTQDFSRVRAAERGLIKKMTGIDEGKIIFLNQVHGDTIIEIDNNLSDSFLYAGDGDALITEHPGTCLVIRTADCVPLFLYDSIQRVLGAVHSGWRGTEKEISLKVLKRMISHNGASVDNLMAYILPSIGPESYKVNSDVADYFPDDINVLNEGLYLDLWKHIENSIKDAGVLKKNIFNPYICNYTQHNDFFSHRRGDAGRNLNFAYMIE